MCRSTLGQSATQPLLLSEADKLYLRFPAARPWVSGHATASSAGVDALLDALHAFATWCRDLICDHADLDASIECMH